MTLERIYIYLSEGEEIIDRDYEELISKGFVDENEIKSLSSVLVCISRDYINTPHNTPAIRIIDQLSNVFCPEWRINSIRYEAMTPIMYLRNETIPEIVVITKNDEIYDNMDYYLHLTYFENRFKMNLNDSNPYKEPIESQVRRQDVKEIGIMTSDLGFVEYDIDVNGSLPGWVFQPANPWLTRLLNLYQVSPAVMRDTPKMSTLKISKEDFTRYMENPVILGGPKIHEDIMTMITESFEFRREIMDLTIELLEKIDG